MMRVLVSNIMMANERDRFDAILRDRGIEPIWPEVDQFMDEAQCLTYAGEVDGWLAGDDRITASVFDAFLPRLKVVSKWGTGMDSIDLVAARARDVPVCNSPGAFRDAVGEYAMGMLLAASRRIALNDRRIREGQWPKGRYIGLTGKTMGVIGYGAIGQGVGQRARGMGMDVVAFDPYLTQSPDGAELLDFTGLLSRADVICLCCNLTTENHHLLDAKAFAAMREDVMIVNVARGGLIDEMALLEALRVGKVSAAGIDVFEIEPVPADHPLLAEETVVVSSHNANSTIQAIEAVHENTLGNLFRHLSL